MRPWLKRLDTVPDSRRRPVEPDILRRAAEIVEDVRMRGEPALREHCERLGDLAPGEGIVLESRRLEHALDGIPSEQRDLLERVAGRIREFASEQRGAVTDVDVAVVGGRAGHNWVPVASAGAYAPGGRHPLPSSVLMTVVTARVAGVGQVWVASPRPTEVTLAAAAVSGADGLLAVGGAQAIAALALGTVSPPSDLIVGPGNRWVTAAKKHLYGEVGIDGLAGPSEIVVIADDTADPEVVAADLLAQAEHDEDAMPMLITNSAALADRVETSLGDQLRDLPTSATAERALENGFCVVVETLEAAGTMSDRIAPEHLAVHGEGAISSINGHRAYGSLFIGGISAEVFADYGIGPNHVLPTGGGARYQSGLSVFTFLRAPTWLHLESPGPVIDDTTALARLEGLEAHARAAQWRR